LTSDQLGGRPFFIVGIVSRLVPTQPAFSISSTATKRAWALSSLVHECAKSTKVLVISALGEASAIRRQLRACLRHSLGSPGIGTIPLADRLLLTPHRLSPVLSPLPEYAVPNCCKNVPSANGVVARLNFASCNRQQWDQSSAKRKPSALVPPNSYRIASSESAGY